MSIGNKNIMAKNIEHYLIEQNKTRKELCNDLDIVYTTFCSWITGQSYPRIDKIEKMAEYFGVTKSDLIEDHSALPKNAISIDESCKLPIIGNVSAGNGSTAYDDVLGYAYAEARFCNDEYFYLRVTGDSMTPKIEEGDLVLVHKQDSVDSGSYAVVTVDGEDGCVKLIKYGVNWIELHSINHYYPVRRFEGADVLRLRVIGKVIRINRSL